MLWGTLLMDFESEAEAQSSMTPRGCMEVLGVSEWDGKGRATHYPFGFLLVTHTGGTYYVSVPTQQERDTWVLNLKRGLECVFANPEVAPFKPSKILQKPPTSWAPSPSALGSPGRADALPAHRCCSQPLQRYFLQSLCAWLCGSRARV